MHLGQTCIFMVVALAIKTLYELEIVELCDFCPTRLDKIFIILVAFGDCL